MTMWASNAGGAESPFYPYEINQSVLMAERDDNVLYDTSRSYTATLGERRYKHAFSTWVKRSSSAARYQYIFGYRYATGSILRVGFGTGHNLWVHDYAGGYRTRLDTSNLFRDLTNWFHIFYKYDCTQAVASDRVKLWVNGEQVTDFVNEIYPALNQPSLLFAENSTTDILELGAARNTDNARYTIRGYLSESYIIDGWECANFDLITVNDFGFEKNGVWIPKKYKYRGKEGYGNYGGYYTYENAGNLGQDFSGNGNDLLNNGTLTTDNQVNDSPTNNRCTLNEADAYSETDGRMRYGGLEWIYTSTVWLTARATMQVSSGKWYYEAALRDLNYSMIGWIWSRYRIQAVQSYVGSSTWQLSCSIYANSNNGTYQLYSVGHGLQTNTSTSILAGDTMLTAADFDNDLIWFGVRRSNGTTYWFNFSGGTTGDPENGVNPTFPLVFINSDYRPVSPAGSTYSQSLGNIFNFGQWPMPSKPKGFRSLCSKNLEDSRIYDPTVFHSANVRAGDSVNNKLVDFNEKANDFSISKSRSTANGWVLYNRFLNENQNLTWGTGNSTFDPTQNTGGGIGSFTKRKYKLVSGTSNMDNINTTGYNYIDYTWGSERDIGIELVSYVGNGGVQQVYHNLRREPHMIWTKSITTVTDWGWYHLGMGDGATSGWLWYALVNTGAARVSDPGGAAWNTTRPNSEYFTVGSGGFNTLGATYIAYVFAPIPGFSVFGGYGETGSTNGGFMYCDFTPKWLFQRQITTASNGIIKDTYREKNNPLSLTLVPDSAASEYASNNPMDFLSTGVKYRAARTANALSLFAAFAENPFKHSNAR